MGTVGNFEIQGELERTPGYTAYSAVHRQLGPVVLKVLSTGSPTALEVRQRFLSEAALLTQLDHPNLQRVVEVGDEGGQLYVAMVPTPAQRIGALLQQRPEALPVLTAIQIGCRLADALEYAHAKGVVHRDITLNSVLLGPDGFPLLTDFGFIRDVDPTAPGVAQTGRCMGTPGYNSPEQASGQISKISPISDIYMLGAVLYTLLVRQTPIQGNSPMGIMARTMSQEPVAPRSLRADVPADVEQVVLRCLAKAPEQRYASAADLRRALEGILSAASGERPPAGVAPTAEIHLKVPSGVPALPPVDMFAADGKRPPRMGSGRRRRRSRQGEDGPIAKKRGIPVVQVAIALVVAVGGVGFMLSGKAPRPEIVETPEDTPDTPDAKPVDPPSLAETTQTLLAAGVEFLGKEDYAQAIESLDKALALDPDMAPAYNSRGNAHYGLEDFEAAYADFSRVVELRPKVAEGFHNKASAAESLGKTEEAIAAYGTFLELEPGHAYAEAVRKDLERLRGKLKK